MPGNKISAGSLALSYDIGKFSLSYIIKSALRSDAHSHERQMSAKADHARRSKKPSGKEKIFG